VLKKMIACAKDQSYWLYAAAAAATVLLLL